MSEVARLYAMPDAAEADEQPALVLPTEAAYVTETATGLTFRPDTPLDLWAGLVRRLIVGRQRISFALADAINFGRDRYGDVYAQWVDETGLQETTLANVAWVGRQVPPSRRREGIDFTYHQAVAPLPPEKQTALLDEAVDKGWKRFQLRAAVQVVEKQLAGGAVDAAGVTLDSAPLVWCPDIGELTDDARRILEAHAPLGRARATYVSAWIACLVRYDQRDQFRSWEGPQ